MSHQAVTPAVREDESDMLAALTLVEVEQPVPLLIVDGDDVQVPQTKPSMIQIAHADDTPRRFVIREEIPRAPEAADSRDYPQIQLYTEEELRVLLGRDEPTPPLLLAARPETSAEPMTPSRPVRQPGISTGGTSSWILRRSGRLRGESASSPSTDEKLEVETSPRRSTKGKSPARSPREKKEEKVRLRLRRLDEEKAAREASAVPMSESTGTSSDWCLSSLIRRLFPRWQAKTRRQ